MCVNTEAESSDFKDERNSPKRLIIFKKREFHIDRRFAQFLRPAYKLFAFS